MLVSVSISAGALPDSNGTTEVWQQGFEICDDGFDPFRFRSHRQERLFEVEVQG